MTEPIASVLVVDDEKVVRDGCRRVLCGRGYQVDLAGSGQEAMERLGDGPVDIILLDLKMPGMSGEELLDRVRDLYPDIPVIVITGHGTVDTAVECMKKGAYDFITKPFEVEPFLLTVNRAADKRRLEQKSKQFEEQNIRNLYDLYLEQSRLKTIINCMADGVMVTNRNLEVVLHNPALMRLLEVMRELENPFPISEIFQQESFLDTLRKIQSGESAADEAVSQELRIGKKTLRAISAPALGPDKAATGTVTVLEDVTAFKQLDQMKSDFVNMVAHELRSPLVSIRQINTVLLEGLAGPLKEKQQEFIDRGVRKIDGLLDLINDLLNVARLEAGGYVESQVPTDIGEVIEQTVSLMDPRAREQRITLHYECEDLKPVQANPKTIEQVFTNLISNAINYSPNGGGVSVKACCRGEYLEIKVADNGVGIPSDELPKIFDKFYRVKHSQTRQVTGTGLGLSIVKGIVEAHRGTIEVDSELGRGTTFRILLPVVKP